MNESEFRDWARRAQGNFDERLKALERKVGSLVLAPPRVREAIVRANLQELIKNLSDAVNQGQVTAVGIAFVTEDGVPHTGWANEHFDRFTLVGAAAQLMIDLADKPKGMDEDEPAQAAAEVEG